MGFTATAQQGQIIDPFVYNPPGGPLEIIHEDDDLILVNKPSGLLSVPGKAIHHRDCLETRLRDQYTDALLIHRLDMSTSGIMIFARNKNAQRHLGLQFEKRHVQKTYQAEVWGTIHAKSGHINLPLICDWPNRPRQIVDFVTGKSAQTDWVLIEQNEYSARLSLFPKTGRSHQLRVHCQAIGHPILGDPFYASGEALMASDRLMLHAETLKFRHPNGGEWLELTAPCPF